MVVGLSRGLSRTGRCRVRVGVPLSSSRTEVNRRTRRLVSVRARTRPPRRQQQRSPCSMRDWATTPNNRQTPAPLVATPSRLLRRPFTTQPPRRVPSRTALRRLTRAALFRSTTALGRLRLFGVDQAPGGPSHDDHRRASSTLTADDPTHSSSPRPLPSLARRQATPLLPPTTHQQGQDTCTITFHTASATRIPSPNRTPRHSLVQGTRRPPRPPRRFVPPGHASTRPRAMDSVLC